MKYSILIPAYKKKYLSEAIESCLDQTYNDFELIIVNDHSPEDLDSVVSQYDDVRIKYYVNDTNIGAIDVVDNWNKCLSYAQGDFVICMGDDDRLMPCCLEEYEALINKYNYLDVYHARTEIIDEDGLVIGLQEARPEWESAYSALWHQCCCHRIQFIGDFLFRTISLKKEGGFYKLPLATFSDNISTIRAAKKNGIANTQKICFQYRMNGGTITNNGNPRIIVNSIKSAYDWFVDFLQDSPSDDTDINYRRFLLEKELKTHIYEMMMIVINWDLSKEGVSAIPYWKSHYKELGIDEEQMNLEFKSFRRYWYISKLKKILGR